MNKYNANFTTSAKGLTKGVYKKSSSVKEQNKNKLVIGLGNIGKQYAETRHNVGFLILDKFAQKLGANDFTLDKKLKSLITKTKLGSKNIIMAKPYGYMNESGVAVRLLVNYYKTALTHIYIVHDECDLPFGKTKISVNASSAGHKGVESIIQELKTKNFIRLRIGTGQPIAEVKPAKRNLKKIVLKDFTSQEVDELHFVIEKTITAIGLLLEDNISQAMTIYNR